MICLACCVVAFAGAPVHAQQPPNASVGVAASAAPGASTPEPARGTGVATRVGRDDGALPGVRRVGVLLPRQGDYAVHLGADYGRLGSALDAGDSHHLVAARLAAAMQPLDWLGVGLRFDGLHVQHTGGPDDGDGGTLTRTRLTARAHGELQPQIQVGGELRLRVPAAQTAGDAFTGLSADLRGLASYAPQGAPWLVSGVLGVRLDNTARAIKRPAGYTLSDRAVLGVSNSNALQLGVAGSYRVNSIDILGEWSWDMYLGGNAPDLPQSPMWLTGGGRYWLAASTHLDLLATLRVSATPGINDDSPLTVIGPRFWLGAALGMRFDGPAARAPQAVVAAPVAPAPAQRVNVQGQVRGPEGEPIAGASITYRTSDGPQQVIADAEGRFQLVGIPVGSLAVDVLAEGYQPFTYQVQALDGAPAVAEVMLERPLPEGQIRGTVKDFKGHPVRASIRIRPLGKRVRVDALGEFEVDVPPGEYTVVISADGFRSQTRPATVHDNGVTVVIVDLRKQR